MKITSLEATLKSAITATFFFLLDDISPNQIPLHLTNSPLVTACRDTHLLLLAVAEWIHQRGGCQLQVGETIGCKLCMLLNHLLHTFPFLVLLCVSYLNYQWLSAPLHTKQCIWQERVSASKRDYRKSAGELETAGDSGWLQMLNSLEEFDFGAFWQWHSELGFWMQSVQKHNLEEQKEQLKLTIKLWQTVLPIVNTVRSFWLYCHAVKLYVRKL